jgi:hypothetical protein
MSRKPRGCIFCPPYRGGGCVLRRCVLRFGSIVGLDVGVWLVLRFGWGRMFKTCQRLGKIAWHQEVDLSSVVIPFYGESAIALPYPVT